jgi:hypothetical protein
MRGASEILLCFNLQRIDFSGDEAYRVPTVPSPPCSLHLHNLQREGELGLIVSVLGSDFQLITTRASV